MNRIMRNCVSDATDEDAAAQSGQSLGYLHKYFTENKIYRPKAQTDLFVSEQI